MALEDDGPRQLHVATRGDEAVAEDVVHVPDEEAGEESQDPCGADMSVFSSLSFSLSPAPASGHREQFICGQRTSPGQVPHRGHDLIHLGGIALAEGRPERVLHDVHAAEDGGQREHRVGDLVEHGILGVEIVGL